MKITNTSKLLTALVLGLSTATTFAAFSGSDDFNDNSQDLSKWGTDAVQGGGALNETSQVLRYTTSGATSNDFAVRPWIANTGSFTSNWILQIDVNIPALTLATGQSFLFGLRVVNGDDPTDRFLTALELDNFSGIPNRHFLSAVHVNGVNQGEIKSDSTSTSAAVRIRYDAATTTLFSEFDADGAVGGYNFTNFDSRNISSWNMTAASVFQGAAWGASEGNVVISSANNVAGDNFLATPEPSSVILILSGAALCLRRRSLRAHERIAYPLVPKRGFRP